MAHHVPDFEMDHSSPRKGNKTPVGDEEFMELLWHDGQVVAHTQNHTQNHRSFKKPTNGAAGDAEFPPPQSFTSGREIPSVDAETLSRQRNQNQNQHQQLFIQEDEMASWLQYPLEDYSLDREIYSDIFYSPISAPTTPHRDVRSSLTEVSGQPLLPPLPVAPSTFIVPQSPQRSADVEIPASNFQNFLNFSRVPRARVVESAPSSSNKAAGELTRAESKETPTAGQNSRFSLAIGSSAQPSNGNVGTSALSTSTAGRGFATTGDLTVTTSPGGSGTSVNASVEATPAIHKPASCTVEERKRKEREPDIDDSEEQDEEFVSTEEKNQSHKSTIKRTRASEVHNLSERKRRDRINDRMKALQELIPRCNKVDKASMLDEAIEYLKSLQLHVQMMSMGCGMVPMMYPGAQQYMPAMGMGAMGMGMGMNHPMMTYPAQFSGSGFPFQPAAANLAPRFPMPAFPLQQIPVPDTARNPTSIQPYPMLHSITAHGSNQVRMSTPVVDPYQQLVGFQQAQVPVQSQVGVHHNNKPSSSRVTGNQKNEKTG